jgi:sugar porter (SP) family MFS transporter
MLWRELHKVPREMLNKHLWLGVVAFGLMGAARGFDEGNISGTVTQPAFIRQFGLADHSKSDSQLANIKSNVTAMVQLGSIAGSVVGFIVIDYLGRVKSLRFLITLWIIGVLTQITAANNGCQFYIGRFVAGIGIGMTSVVCPTYLVELAPPEIRGLCTCFYSGSVYLGIMLGYFANWGTTLHISKTNRNQWVIPTSMQLIFAGMGIIGSLFVQESPRWLYKVNQDEKAINGLTKIRGFPRDSEVIQEEVSRIWSQLETESDGQKSKRKQLRQLFVDTRYQMVLGLMIQLLAQWTGANAVTIYAPEFFTLAGIESQDRKLFAASMFGVVKLIAAICCALFIIDCFGRKRALYIGISFQTLSMLYIGIFLAIKSPSPGVTRSLPAGVASAAVAMIYMNGIGWALGWNSIQYLINAEIFPLRLRSMSSSIIMFFHYVNQYANSRALPSMLLAMNNWGAMIFFAVVCAIGLLFAWFFIPEAAGQNLESVEELFNRPWYKVGRYKPPVKLEQEETKSID